MRRQRASGYGGVGYRLVFPILVAALAILLLAACERPEGSRQPPVAIVSGDMSAVSGMYIERYPGPRAEAYLLGAAKPLKFDSTRDFFAYVTRPDIKKRLGAVYVQDTARIEWKHPSNSANSFVNARKAWYVAFQPLMGAMGPTLASFAKRTDTEAFIHTHGGALLRYGQVSSELISNLGYRCPVASSHTNSVVKGCVQQRHASAAPHKPRAGG